MKLPSLLPREEKFHHMLEDLVGHANASVGLLDRMMHTADPAAIRNLGGEISAVKDQAKQVYRTLTEEVCRTFITPYDREDLQAFAHTLYSIPKLIKKIQDRMVTHELRPFNRDFTRMVEIIALEAEAMARIIHILNNGRKMKEMHEKADILHELEDRGDQLLGQLIAELFISIENTREVVLRKDIYEMLEDVTDYYRDCANLALQILLKHS